LRVRELRLQGSLPVRGRFGETIDAASVRLLDVQRLPLAIMGCGIRVNACADRFVCRHARARGMSVAGRIALAAIGMMFLLRHSYAEVAMMNLRLSSSAFADGGAIPARYTCEGRDVSPPLAWSGVPVGTRSLALIVDDPDAPDPRAPKMTWVHWVVFDLPPTARGLPEAVDASTLPGGMREGVNDWKRSGYGGPCPPVGRHRYFHKLYALDTTLELERPTKAQLETAMRGHVLATAQLIGTYLKQQ
jgi:Raf kinase inhibitor-like YbhB/YbcL family protein